MRLFKSKSTVFALVALLLLFWATVLWQSLRDEPLAASVREQLAYRPPQGDPRQNAYVALVGFNAPADSDILTVGQAAIEQANAKAAKDPDISQAPEQELFIPLNAPRALIFSPPSFKNPCGDLARTSDCLPAIAEQSDVIAQNLQQNAVLLERYRLMQRLPVFTHTSAPPVDTPHYGELVSSSNLLAAAALLDIQQGRIEQGLDFFERDIAFYRTILAGENTLISAMIARQRLLSHYHTLNLLIADPAFPATNHAARLRALLAPFEQKDKNLHAALAFEQRYALTMFMRASLFDTADKQGFMQDTAHKGQLLFSQLFLKKNMTANAQNASRERSLARTDALTEDSLPHLLKNPPRPENLMFDISALYGKYGLLFWRNYFGEILVSISSTNYLEYIAAVYDMAIYARLVDAQLQLRIDALPPRDIPARLQQPNPVFLDPYTGRPFDWRAEDNTLSFTPLAERTYKKTGRPTLTARLPP